MDRISWGACFIVTAATAACAAPHQESAQPAPSRHAAASAGEMPCPAAVPGTQLSVEDAPMGAAVTFTTTGDVNELRRRVHAMADMHNTHQHGESMDHGGGMMHGMMGHGTGHEGSMQEPGAQAGAMAMPPSQATVTDVPDGATLTVTAVNASDVESLRRHLREHAEMMRAGNCPGGAMHQH